MTAFTVGVEEEFHLVDAATGALRADVAEVLRHVPHEENVEPELLRTQIETGTPVCQTLAQVRGELDSARRALSASAAKAGCRLAAGGTWPGPVPPVPATEKPRYEAIAERFGPIAHEATVCGCHVHVGVEDPSSSSPFSAPAVRGCRCFSRSPPTRRSGAAPTPDTPATARRCGLGGRPPGRRRSCGRGRSTTTSSRRCCAPESCATRECSTGTRGPHAPTRRSSSGWPMSA